MTVAQNKVVTIAYSLLDQDGQVISGSTHEGLAYLQGSGQLIPGLETQMLGRKIGDAFRVEVPCKDAYGPRDEENHTEVPRSEFEGEGDLEVGLQLEGVSEEGHRSVYTITEVRDDVVVLDGNHPLAGLDLTFDIKVIEIRDATPEELQHGHAHGQGGVEHGVEEEEEEEGDTHLN